MKRYYKVISLLLAVSMCFSLSGCGKEKNDSQTGNGKDVTTIDTITRELRQNDYRGGVKRTLALQENVLEVMENMKANNIVIRSDSPNSFWTAEGYQDFVSTFLDIAIINDTQWFNEEQTDWETVIQQLSTTANSFTTLSEGNYTLNMGITFERNEKDDYSIKGATDTISTDSTLSNTKVYTGKANYRILYDCDKDWCKSYSNLSVITSIPELTTQMFEYQRIDDNNFIIQTSKERLMVILEPAEADTDVRERKIKEFYYSKLVSEGQRTTFEPYEPLPEIDATGLILKDNIKQNEIMATYPEINDKGNFCVRYGQSDSMFYRSPKEITRDWVYEDKSLQQAISYKDGILVVTTYNKLSTLYERFIYALADTDEKVAKELENIVEIDNLVGIQTSIVKNENEKGTNNNVSETTPENNEENAETSKAIGSDTEASSEASSEVTTNTSGANPADVERELAMGAVDGKVQVVTGG